MSKLDKWGLSEKTYIQSELTIDAVGSTLMAGIRRQWGNNSHRVDETMDDWSRELNMTLLLVLFDPIPNTGGKYLHKGSDGRRQYRTRNFRGAYVQRAPTSVPLSPSFPSHSTWSFSVPSPIHHNRNSVEWSRFKVYIT